VDGAVNLSIWLAISTLFAKVDERRSCSMVNYGPYTQSVVGGTGATPWDRT
jgi:hypothetical protein